MNLVLKWVWTLVCFCLVPLIFILCLLVDGLDIVNDFSVRELRKYTLGVRK